MEILVDVVEKQQIKSTDDITDDEDIVSIEANMEFGREEMERNF